MKVRKQTMSELDEILRAALDASADKVAPVAVPADRLRDAVLRDPARAWDAFVGQLERDRVSVAEKTSARPADPPPAPAMPFVPLRNTCLLDLNGLDAVSVHFTPALGHECAAVVAIGAPPPGWVALYTITGLRMDGVPFFDDTGEPLWLFSRYTPLEITFERVGMNRTPTWLAWVDHIAELDGMTVGPGRRVVRSKP